MTTTTTDRDEVFTDEQRARAKALDTARGLVTKVGFASGEVNVPVAEIVDLAEYIITGTHPLDRYDDERTDEERCEGCASTEIAAHDSEGVPLCAPCDKADRDEQAEEEAARADD